MKRALSSGLLAIATGCGGASTCPATEPPPSSTYSVQDVIDAATKDAASIDGRDVTVCGFVWHEYEEDALWQDDAAFEHLRACIASAATCVERKNKARLTLTGNREKWRDWKGDRACINGTFHVARASTNNAISPLEIAVRCVRK